MERVLFGLGLFCIAIASMISANFEPKSCACRLRSMVWQSMEQRCLFPTSYYGGPCPFDVKDSGFRLDPVLFCKIEQQYSFIGQSSSILFALSGVLSPLICREETAQEVGCDKGLLWQLILSLLIVFSFQRCDSIAHIVWRGFPLYESRLDIDCSNFWSIPKTLRESLETSLGFPFDWLHCATEENLFCRKWSYVLCRNVNEYRRHILPVLTKVRERRVMTQFSDWGRVNRMLMNITGAHRHSLYSTLCMANGACESINKIHSHHQVDRVCFPTWSW